MDKIDEKELMQVAIANQAMKLAEAELRAAKAEHELIKQEIARKYGLQPGDSWDGSGAIKRVARLAEVKP